MFTTIYPSALSCLRVFMSTQSWRSVCAYATEIERTKSDAHDGKLPYQNFDYSQFERIKCSTESGERAKNQSDGIYLPPCSRPKRERENKKRLTIDWQTRSMAFFVMI